MLVSRFSESNPRYSKGQLTIRRRIHRIEDRFDTLFQFKKKKKAIFFNRVDVVCCLIRLVIPSLRDVKCRCT